MASHTNEAGAAHAECGDGCVQRFDLTQCRRHDAQQRKNNRAQHQQRRPESGPSGPRAEERRNLGAERRQQQRRRRHMHQQLDQQYQQFLAASCGQGRARRVHSPAQKGHCVEDQEAENHPQFQSRPSDEDFRRRRASGQRQAQQGQRNAEYAERNRRQRPVSALGRKIGGCGPPQSQISARKCRCASRDA